MVIISKTKLIAFSKIYPIATISLNNWYNMALNANWKNYNEIKKVVNSVDAVGNDRYVFNIMGNNFRMVVMIHFDTRTIYVRFIGTHSQYNKINCSTI